MLMLLKGHIYHFCSSPEVQKKILIAQMKAIASILHKSKSKAFKKTLKRESFYDYPPLLFFLLEG